jgi:hypothetical protein
MHATGSVKSAASFGPWGCFDGSLDWSCNELLPGKYDSPYAGQFVYIHPENYPTECLQNTKQYDSQGSVMGGINSRMDRVANEICQPQASYYVLPDGNTATSTSQFSLWFYDGQSSGPLMTDAAVPLNSPDLNGGKSKNFQPECSLLADQLYIWADSDTPRFSYAGDGIQGSSTRNLGVWSGDPNLDPYKYNLYSGAFLYRYDAQQSALIAARPQCWTGSYYGCYDNQYYRYINMMDTGYVAICGGASCNAVSHYFTIPGSPNYKSQTCGSGSNVRPWIPDNTEADGCGKKAKYKCQKLNDQVVGSWIQNCYSNGYQCADKVSQNSGMLVHTFGSYDYQKEIGAFTRNMQIDVVPRRDNPVYVKNFGDPCSSTLLSGAGWNQNPCPFFSDVKTVSGKTVISQESPTAVLPSSLDGMPFIQKISVNFNPRAGIDAMILKYYLDPTQASKGERPITLVRRKFIFDISFQV